MRLDDRTQILWDRARYALGITVLTGLVVLLLTLQVALMTGQCGSLMGEECLADFQPQWSSFRDLFTRSEIVASQ
jgi:hypothetical protein